jgi:enterochelin esterase-like enzyme
MDAQINNIIFRPFFSLLLFVVFCATSCSKEVVNPGESNEYHEFSSYADFITTLEALSIVENDSQRATKLNTFWDSLVSNNQVPFVLNDSVAFLYKKEGSTINWAGDFNGWSPSWRGKQVGLSDINIYETVFPADARLDYKIIDNDRWLLDPDNEFIQYSGFGPNSELRMPAYEYPIETLENDLVPKGSFSGNFSTQSTNLGYKVQYRVYAPFNYNAGSNLPVIYVTDGHEYADDKLGSMITILDNLIYDGVIAPIIAVFIDPRNPDNLAQNRRGDEYTANMNYADFVADELVILIDNTYKTSTNADDRAILGTSLGGWNAAYFGLMRSDKFHLVAIHSPAFDSKIIDDYNNSPKLPLKIFMSTGVIHDTEDKARAMKSTMENKAYQMTYQEVNQGHSWGNWRGLIKQPLAYFFPPIN